MGKGLTYEPALDGLRGVAVLSVLTFHAYPGVAPGGWAGVDVFFVLSGYLITRLLSQELEATGTVNLLGFYLRRARRLMPVFLAMLAILLPLILTFHHQRADWTRAWVIAAAYLMNWSRAFGWGPDGGFGHTWSLAEEEQFYLLWPLLFIFIWRRRPLIWIVGLIVASVCWRIFLVIQGAPFVRIYNGFDTHSSPLLIGCALGILQFLPSQTRSLSRTWFVWVLAFAMVVVALPITSVGAETIGISAISGIAVMLIALSGNGPLHYVLSAAPLRFTGKISYALYLWHYPLLVLMLPKWNWMNPIIPLALAYGIATISYFTIEAYFRRRSQAPQKTLVPFRIAAG